MLEKMLKAHDTRSRRAKLKLLRATTIPLRTDAAYTEANTTYANAIYLGQHYLDQHYLGPTLLRANPT